MKDNAIKELNWSEIRDVLVKSKGNGELLELLDNLPIDDSYTAIHVKYPFGSSIVENASLYLPSYADPGKTVPMDESGHSTDLLNKLKYHAIPLGIVLKNCAEVYREIDNKVFSLVLSGANAGIELGIIELFGSTTTYSISAGARSLYMVPKISKSLFHKRLRRDFGVYAPAPKKIQDHWSIFKELYKSSQFPKKWECEMIFLTKKWADGLKSNDSAWKSLMLYIHRKGWEHSELGRKKVILDTVWQQASSILTEQGTKPDPYIIDTLKHLIFISLGGVSGSRPCSQDDYVGPISAIQDIYTHCYGLKEHIPTIMRPYTFSLKEGTPVYYSMQTPLLLSSTPNFRSMSSNIEDMRELMHTKETVFNQDYGNLKINNVNFNEILNSIQFDYFHSHTYAYGQQIRPTSEMPKSDALLIQKPQSCEESLSGAEFAHSGNFVRGCVKISKKSFAK